jgi:hypothetical protein
MSITHFPNKRLYKLGQKASISLEPHWHWIAFQQQNKSYEKQNLMQKIPKECLELKGHHDWREQSTFRSVFFGFSEFLHSGEFFFLSENQEKKLKNK